MSNRPPFTRTRLAIVVSHPIQHFVPFYRALANEPSLNLKVLFGSRIGVDSYFDKEMDREIRWAMDLLGGYTNEFLKESESIRSSSPFAFNNPSVHGALSNFKPNAVVIYGYSHVTAFRAFFWCKMSGSSVLMVSDSELRRTRRGLTSLMKKIILGSIFRHIDAFLTVGDNNEQYLQHYGVPMAKLFRSPFTIDEERFEQARVNLSTIRADFRRRYEICDDETVALFVGKLSERKRPRDLIEAAMIMRKNGKVRLRCVFAGSGLQTNDLQNLARSAGLDSVFLGFLNVDSLPAAYCASDILVHPSSADPHPLVCSEAACIGLPMVLSDRVGAEGPTDVARAGANAEVYPCGDVEALARILEDLIEDKVRLGNMAAKSREIFDELNLSRSTGGLLDALAACRAKKMIKTR